MNDSVDCPMLEFTDDLIAQPAAPCGASLLGFVVPLGIICLLRLLISFVIWRGWIRRFSAGGARSKGRRRFPIFPLLSSVTGIGSAVILVFAPLQVLPSFAVVFIMGILHTCFWASALLTLRYFIHIARRMMRYVDDEAAATAASSADLFLRISFRISEFLNVAMLAASFASLGLTSNPVLSFQVLNYIGGCCALVCAHSQAYQQSRILKIVSEASKIFAGKLPSSRAADTVKQSPASFQERSAPNASSVDEERSRVLARQVQIQRLSVFFWSISGVMFSTFFFCIATGVVASDFKAIVATFAFETLLSLFGTWSNLPRAPPARKRREVGALTASVFQGGSTFLDLASGPLSAMVLRAGEETYTQIALNALQEEIQDCVVVDDDGHDASILTQHFILVDPRDTITTALVGAHTTELALRLIEVITALPLVLAIVFWTVLGLGGLFVIGVVLTGFAPSWLAFCFPLFAVLEGVLLGGAINRPVLLRLMRTSFFAWRLFAATVSAVVLVLALQDLRALMVTSLWLAQMLGFCSDAFTGPLQQHRFTICIVVWLATAEVFVLITAGLVTSSNPVIFTISRTFDYSFMQLVRDMYLAMSIVLAFESESIWRGAHRRRFLHITESVSYHIKTLEAESVANRASTTVMAQRVMSTRLFGPNPGKRNKFAGQASQLEVKSGFFVKQQSITGADESQTDDNQSQKSMAFVHVNNIQLKQSASVAFALFGRERGQNVFHDTLGCKGTVLTFLTFSTAWLSLLSFPFLGRGLPYNLPLLALFSTLLLAFLKFMQMSVPMLRLLVWRRRFFILLVFLTAWFAVIVVVLADARIAVAIFIYMCVIVEYLVDARLTVPKRYSRMFEKLNSALMFLVLAGFLVFGTVDNRGLYIVFRSDLVVNGTINSDSGFVVDCFQGAVDLMLSFAIQRVAMLAYLWWKRKPSEFQQIGAPVVPRYSGGSISV